MLLPKRSLSPKIFFSPKTKQQKKNPTETITIKAGEDGETN
jgi:hypothetical protein